MILQWGEVVVSKCDSALMGDILELEEYRLGESSLDDSRLAYVHWNDGHNNWVYTSILEHCSYNWNTYRWEKPKSEPTIMKKPNKLDSHGYTTEQVWAFLAPKMYQFTDVMFVDNKVMEMVVAAYRSGYVRAEKGRNYEIGKPKSKK